MMKGIFILVVCLTTIVLSTDDIDLVIILVQDGMSSNAVRRSWASLDGGLKEYATNGVMYPQTDISTRSGTGPGHTTLHYGSTASINGIIANTIRDKSDGKGKNAYWCDGVTEVSGVTYTPYSVGNCPNTPIGTTIADEHKKAYPDSWIAAVGGKPRSTLSVGRSADELYWYVSGSRGYGDSSLIGRFISTTAVMDAYDQWFIDYNDNLISDNLEQGSFVWDLALDRSKYNTRDNVDGEYEGAGEFSQVIPESTFPKELIATEQSDLGGLDASPFMDKMICDLSIELIERRQMGQRGVPDLLVVHASSTDLVKHDFGDEGLEAEDIFLHLNENCVKPLLEATRNMKTLFIYASDHGMGTKPSEDIKDGFKFAGYTDFYGEDKLENTEQAVKDASYIYEINEAVKVEFGIALDVIPYVVKPSRGKWAMTSDYVTTGNIYLTEDLAYGLKDAVVDFIVDMMRDDDRGWFEIVSSKKKVLDGDQRSQTFEELVHPRKSGEIVFSTGQKIHGGPRRLNAQHGTLSAYDSKLMTIIAADDIEGKQVIWDQFYTTWIASFYAAYMNTDVPTGCRGQVTKELMANRNIFG